jgi:multisite-specific tRNA:(cytosine-C5)-methyltransferase
VTNHEAQNFPDIVSRGGRTFQFDAILCDVPCSGDGTMRKAPDIWPRWSVGNGNGLHPLQLKIAIRAAQLLKVGGRLVYSTCTFNPIENEAVIAALLEQSEGSLELLDMSGQLPELRRTPGIHTWEVHTKAGKANSFEEGQEVAKVHPTMWPKPSYQKLPLERCMRLLPHHDDTGGFFVAVFEKKAPMPASLDPPPKKLKGPITVKTDLVVDQTGTVKVEFSLVNTFELRAEREALAANGGKPVGPEDELLLTETRGGGTRNRQGGGSQFGGLDPILPVSDAKVIHSIRDTYGIDLAKLSLDKNAVTRTADNTRPKRIYALTDGLREYLAADHKEQLKVIAAGLKVFERQEHKEATAGGGQCDFRLVQDGLHVMLPFVTKQIIHPTLDELRLILQRRSLQLPGAEDPEKPDRAKFMDDATKAEVNAAVSGSCVFVPRISDADVAALPAGCSPEEIAIACWKGKSSVNLLVSKVETDHLLEKLGMPAGAKDAAKGGGMEVN